MIRFIKDRIRSLRYASKGAYLLLKNEPNFQVQCIIAILVTILGFIVGLDTTEWCIQVLTIVSVMAAEGLNTAVEKAADFIHPERHPKIGTLKDIAAGAVFITAIGAIIVGLLLYVPKIF